MISIYSVHRFYILRTIRPKPIMFLQYLNVVSKIPTYEHGWNVSPRSTCPFLTQKHNTTNRKSACRRMTAMSEQCRLVGSSSHLPVGRLVASLGSLIIYTSMCDDVRLDGIYLRLLRTYVHTLPVIPMIYTQTATCGQIAHTNVTSDRVNCQRFHSAIFAATDGIASGVDLYRTAMLTL